MSFTSAVNTKAIEIGKLSVEMTTAAGSGHPSTSLSLAHLVTVLMYHQMRWDPKDPWNGASDRLVLSEGHAVPIIYAAYADLGGMIIPLGKGREAARPMTPADAMTLRAIDSPIDGHPNPQMGVPFFDAATGSLGQGLSVAAGLASAARMDKLDRNFYVIIGDGESREGQIWEAADFVVDHALTNVIPIFNCNELAQSDYVSPQQSYQGLADKLRAFGFIVRIIDGHDPLDILNALGELRVVQNGQRPLAIVARTIKGWGAPAEQGMGKHGTPVKKDKLTDVLSELDRTAKDLGVCGYKIDGELKIAPITAKAPPREKKPIKIKSFADGLAAVGLDKDLAAGKPIAPRKAYGAALVALGEADKRIIGLDADVKNSTHAEWFAKKFPAQYLECKIAEQNMISVAAGAAAGGKIPFCSTFAKFVERAYDQVEMAIISGADIKITGTHAGVTLAADGPSQMSLPDVAFFRSFCHVTDPNGQPAIRYFFPADAVSCYKITELMANLDGACYQRALAPTPRCSTSRKTTSKSAATTSCVKARTSSSLPPDTWFTKSSKSPMNWPRAARKPRWSMPTVSPSRTPASLTSRKNAAENWSASRTTTPADWNPSLPSKSLPAAPKSRSNHFTSASFPRAAASRRKFWIT